MIAFELIVKSIPKAAESFCSVSIVGIFCPLWENYRLMADEWAIVYNGGKPPALVAVGQGVDYTVNDNALFERFKDNLK